MSKSVAHTSPELQRLAATTTALRTLFQCLTTQNKGQNKGSCIHRDAQRPEGQQLMGVTKPVWLWGFCAVTDNFT